MPVGSNIAHEVKATLNSNTPIALGTVLAVIGLLAGAYGGVMGFQASALVDRQMREAISADRERLAALESWRDTHEREMLRIFQQLDMISSKLDAIGKARQGDGISS